MACKRSYTKHAVSTAIDADLSHTVLQHMEEIENDKAVLRSPKLALAMPCMSADNGEYKVGDECEDHGECTACVPYTEYVEGQSPVDDGHTRMVAQQTMVDSTRQTS